VEFFFPMILLFRQNADASTAAASLKAAAASLKVDDKQKTKQDAELAETATR
jgi:hypothetical protein